MANKSSDEKMNTAISTQVSAEINKVGEKLGKSLVKQFKELEQTLCRQIEEKLLEKLNEKIEKHLTELKTELKSKITEQAEEIEGLKFELNELKEQMQNIKEDGQDLHEAYEELFFNMDSNEQDLKRQNVRVAGVPYVAGQTLDEVTDKVVNIFNTGEIAIAKRDIDRVSISSRPTTRNNVTTQQVLVRFSNWSARQRASRYNNKNRQKTKVRVQADLTRHRFQLLKTVQNHIQEKMTVIHGRDHHRRVNEAQKCFAFANGDSDLVLRLGNDGFKTFRDEQQAKQLIDRFF